MHFHMMQSMRSVNSVCFDNLSSDHILLNKTWDYWALIYIYNSSKCILIWCKPCRVCELNKCELSVNQKVSHSDNKHHCLAWFMYYNNKVSVCITKLVCNKNKIKLIIRCQNFLNVFEYFLPLHSHSCHDSDAEKFAFCKIWILSIMELNTLLQSHFVP